MNFKNKQILARDWYDIVYMEDDIIHVYRFNGSSGIPWDTPVYRYFKPLAELAAAHGMDVNRYDIALSILEACDGKTKQDLIEEIERRRDRNKYMRARRHEDAAAWNKLQEQFSNFVLGVDEVDIYPTGMNIGILLNALKTFEQQRAFVNQNKKALIRHIQKEMPRTKRVSKKQRQLALDTLPYCRLTEITLTRRNLLILRYDIKEEIQRVLEEKE